MDPKEAEFQRWPQDEVRHRRTKLNLSFSALRLTQDRIHEDEGETPDGRED